MSNLRPALARWGWPAAGLALLVACAVLAGRFWHPHYGFTRFVQLDELDHRGGVRELREQPIFVYAGASGYDGAAYTQIAFHPLLDSPELLTGVDNLAYRARRILGSALAWLVAGGNPARIAGVYAGLNLAVWLALAALLWRVLAVRDARSWLAWAGVLTSAGALHSVRLALTDLLATTLLTAAVWQAERGRTRPGLALLAAAGLARETALAAIVAWWVAPRPGLQGWFRRGTAALAVASPLFGWMLYVRLRTGPASQGLGNFTWPVVAWWEKWGETFAAYARHPEFTWLITTTLLATVALTVQAVYVLRRRRTDAWWRVGVVWTVMMALLGTAVWEGHPGAATRVLLPLSVAFAVLAVRERAAWGWLLAGNLSVFSGILALWHVPPATGELSAGRGGGVTFVARAAEGWHGIERRGSAAWAWAAEQGTLEVETAPRGTAPLRLRLRLRALAPREIEVRCDDDVVLRARVDSAASWVTLPPLVPQSPGRLKMTLRALAPPVPESAGPGARALGFALLGVELD
jgi:hypothetical protein